MENFCEILKVSKFVSFSGKAGFRSPLVGKLDAESFIHYYVKVKVFDKRSYS